MKPKETQILDKNKISENKELFQKAYLEFAERSCEALSASGARNQASFDFWQRKVGSSLRRKYHIALQSQICQHMPFIASRNWKGHAYLNAYRAIRKGEGISAEMAQIGRTREGSEMQISRENQEHSP